MGGDAFRDYSKPVHRVRIEPFNIGMTEVTQAQWRAVMGDLPDTGFKGDTLPVESISWNDAVAFCRRLTKLTGFQFRLPTEAEWEYAARAGTTSFYSFGDDDKMLDQYGWHIGNSGNSTHPVGKKLPNPWGLYDMHGNVWEWCQDQWHENYDGAPTDGSAWLSGGDSNYRVVRGGSWYFNSHSCRSADRFRNRPGFRIYDIGLRLVVGARTSSRP
jgi:formylglycine-generating enzyme required for sulfatase activity